MVDATSINGIPVVGAGANGQALFRDGAYLAWHAPDWKPTVVVVPPPASVHGTSITASNTGGRTNRVVVDGAHYSSDFGASGTLGVPKVIASQSFNGTIFEDTDYFTYRDCAFAETFQNVKWGIVPVGTRLEYCTLIPFGAAGSYGIGDSNYRLFRCLLTGNSDGVRTNGDTYIEECFIRVRLANAADHNDGGQATSGSGTIRYRANNIDMRPVAPETVVNTNSCIQLGDWSAGTVVNCEILDNYLNPGQGQYTLKLLDGLNKPGVKFVVRGNKMVKGLNGYLDRGNTPLSQIVWENNTDAVTGALITIS